MPEGGSVILVVYIEDVILAAESEQRIPATHVRGETGNYEQVCCERSISWVWLLTERQILTVWIGQPLRECLPSSRWMRLNQSRHLLC